MVFSELHCLRPNPSGDSSSSAQPPGLAAGIARAVAGATQQLSRSSLLSLLSRTVTASFRAPVRWFRPHRGIGTWDSVRLSHPEAPGVVAAVLEEWRARGWRGLRSHLWGPVAVNATIGAVMFTTYGSLMRRFEPGKETWACVFTAGGCSGALQGLLTCPVAQVRLHMQSSEGRGCATAGQACRDLLRRRGIHGLFQGLPLSLAKESLGVGCFFASYEAVKAELGNALRSPSLGLPVPDVAQRIMTILVAGGSAGIAYQLVHHPLTALQQLTLTSDTRGEYR
eukprot:RCo030346